jgi:hypothetical protein
MWIRIHLFPLKRIRIGLFALMRIRIPNPGPHKVMPIYGHWSTDLPPPLSQGSILSRYASNVSVQGHPWLHFELLKLRNFDFNADPDPASLMIRIRHTATKFFIFSFMYHSPWLLPVGSAFQRASATR